MTKKEKKYQYRKEPRSLSRRKALCDIWGLFLSTNPPSVKEQAQADFRAYAEHQTAHRRKVKPAYLWIQDYLSIKIVQENGKPVLKVTYILNQGGEASESA
ncbi:hypothetical protein ACFYKX_11340 [Cytobacillus sp. FJAT-54145]|uniref:Transposase n=1 Tax=Cytobacillus spartinae TaxID=3299023 RepID=A0ABW6KAE4_9BACI